MITIPWFFDNLVLGKALHEAATAELGNSKVEAVSV
jgi:hypothetical protein